MDKVANDVEHSVIVPAYNEQDGVSVVLQKIFAAIDDSYEVIVVDDGSTDRTAKVAAKFPCLIVSHETNQGKGEALKTGIRAASGRNVIWIDADDTYPAEVIPNIARALSDSYDLVYTSRRWGRTRIPVFNRIGNALFRWAICTFYGFEPYDPCSGLCGVRKGHLERMSLRAREFSIEPEIAMKAGRMRLQMLDIPIEYGSRVGTAKLSGWRAGLEDSLAIVRYLLWRPPVSGGFSREASRS